jgi:hypothetical protein
MTSGDKFVWAFPGSKVPPTEWLLDTNNPYGVASHWGATIGGPWPLTGASKSQTGVSDTPGTDLSNLTEYEASDTFRYWILYKSDKADSIWIPLGVLDWDWKGKATLSAGTWTLSGTGNAVDPSGSETLKFPEWAKKVPTDVGWEKI